VIAHVAQRTYALHTFTYMAAPARLDTAQPHILDFAFVNSVCPAHAVRRSMLYTAAKVLSPAAI
jgi:hypothetical protein